jgi:peptide/nickel transport system permease protein
MLTRATGSRVKLSDPLRREGRPRKDRLRRRLPIFALCLLALIVLSSALAPLIAPQSPLTENLNQAFIPPFYSSGGSFHHVLGTDNLGRDILSRIIYGGRTTLVLAVVTLGIGGTLGTFLGLVSGYSAGIVDGVIQRLVEAILSLPIIMVGLVLAVVLGSSQTTVVAILSPFIAAQFARMSRGDVLRIKRQGYVDLARVAGASPLRIMVKQILPNMIGTITVLATLVIGQLILLEASLSFLGVGVPAPTPDWGLMISEGQNYISPQYWLSLFPGLAIVLTVLTFNLIGDWLRDVFDPKQQLR